MAVAREKNVIIMTADNDAVTDLMIIKGIKVVAGAAGATISLKDENNAGQELYSSVLAANDSVYEEVYIRAKNGVHLDISAGAATVYFYLA